jgi:hypothetical protein
LCPDLGGPTVDSAVNRFEMTRGSHLPHDPSQTTTPRWAPTPTRDGSCAWRTYHVYVGPVASRSRTVQGWLGRSLMRQPVDGGGRVPGGRCFSRCRRRYEATRRRSHPVNAEDYACFCSGRRADAKAGRAAPQRRPQATPQSRLARLLPPSGPLTARPPPSSPGFPTSRASSF